MELRFAKIFDGNRIMASYKTVLQCRQGFNHPWVDIPTEWATPEDEAKYKKVLEEEEKKSWR